MLEAAKPEAHRNPGLPTWMFMNEAQGQSSADAGQMPLSTAAEWDSLVAGASHLEVCNPSSERNTALLFITSLGAPLTKTVMETTVLLHD